jgi:peptidoglycan/LPS O-acetylase OafA/YrhL
MDGLARWWAASAAVAIGCYAVIAGLLVAYPDFSFPTHNVTIVFRLAREIDTWVAIAALIGVAERFLNRDHRWRTTLAEATFPFYIIHQTVIVLVEFWVKPLGIGGAGEFAILVPATIAGCWAFYLVGRDVNVLRPLIGLKARAKAAKPATSADWTETVRARPDVA